MKTCLPWALAMALAGCAGDPPAVGRDIRPETFWRYRIHADAQGRTHACAVEVAGSCEVPLMDGLWCPHGALVRLSHHAQGMSAESYPEPVELRTKDARTFRACDRLTGGDALLPGSGAALPAFAIAPAEAQKQPLVVLRWQPAADRTDWAILERLPGRLRVTPMGPWQIEHLQFQRMERPGPGLENAVLLTFQAGEGSQHAVVKVEIGENGARLRPMTAGDAAMIKGFMGRATEGEKAVLGKVE